MSIEATKIGDGVRNLLEFMKISDSSMVEQITILKSTADLLNQIILSEATAATMAAAFQRMQEKKV